MSFSGFRRPHANFYRLPNTWFDLWQQIRAELGRTRVLGVLKVTEYVIKWTWGRQNFTHPIRLTWLDFQTGRREGSRRLDLGTGLSSRSLQQALTLAEDLGLLERHAYAQGQTAYLPHLHSPEQDGMPEQTAPASVSGFGMPTANYFLVSGGWTDLTADVQSDTLLLTMAYFFRHTWGWQNSRQEACWLSEDEITRGRACPTAGGFPERYDGGTGYSGRAVRDALRESVRRGWLVWRRQGHGGRRYGLHLVGMAVADDGQIQVHEPASVAGESAPAGGATGDPLERSKVLFWNEVKWPPEQSKAPEGTKYSAPYRGITDNHIQTIAADNGGAVSPGGLVARTPAAAVLPQRHEPGVAFPAGAQKHLATSASQEEELGVACSVGVQKHLATSAFQVDAPGVAFPARARKHPATLAAQEEAPGVVFPAGAQKCRTVRSCQPEEPDADLPGDLHERLAALAFQGQGPLAELRAAYSLEPDRIRRWIEQLAAHRAGDPQAGGFLLQVVVRDHAPAPGLPPVPAPCSAAPCPFCGGAGVLLVQVAADDPQHDLHLPCPACRQGAN